MKIYHKIPFFFLEQLYLYPIVIPLSLYGSIGLETDR